MNIRDLIRLRAMKGNSGSYATETDFFHNSVTKLTLEGTQYSFGNAKYANRRNFVDPVDCEWTNYSGYTIKVKDHVVVINGTASSTNDTGIITGEKDIPAGEYIFTITPYNGSSLTNGKNMYIYICL